VNIVDGSTTEVVDRFCYSGRHVKCGWQH